jgi:hypothetical protein
MTQKLSKFPDILAGPILRRLTKNHLVIWLATSRPLDISLSLFRHQDSRCFFSADIQEFSPRPVQIGQHAHIYLIDYVPETDFPTDELLEYDLIIHSDQEDRTLADCIPGLVYKGHKRPIFTVKQKIDHVLHGSCRKPHYPSKDALLRIDEELAETVEQEAGRPALLIMGGDQIYADDVGGPMLVAMHQVSNVLGLFPEKLTGAMVRDSEELLRSKDCYYGREDLLPHSKETRTLRDRFFGGVRKPIFTAATAHNHVVTLSEIIAMYLLVWSPELWAFVDLDAAEIPEPYVDLYQSERREVESFAA